MCSCHLMSVCRSSALPYLLNQSPSGMAPVFALWHPPVLAGHSSRRGGWGCDIAVLQVCQRTWIVRPRPPSVGQYNHRCSLDPSVLECSLISQYLSQFPNLLYVVFLTNLLYRSSLIGSQLSLRRNYMKYRCVSDVFLGESEFSVPCCYLASASFVIT